MAIKNAARNTMNNIKMILENDADTATLSMQTGTSIATLPLSNLQKYNNSRKFGSTDKAEIQIKIDLPQIKPISGLVLWEHNLSNTATVQLQLYSGANLTGTIDFDTGEFDAIPQRAFNDWNWQTQPVVSSLFDEWLVRFTQIYIDPTFCGSLLLTIKDPDNTDDELLINRLYMGQVFSPSVNFSFGHKHQWDDKSTQLSTDDGSLWSIEKPVKRKIKFDLNYLQESERSPFSTQLLRVGKRKDIFVNMFPGTTGQKGLDYAMAAKFTSVPELTGDFHNNFTAPTALAEA